MFLDICLTTEQIEGDQCALSLHTSFVLVSVWTYYLSIVGLHVE